MAAQIIGGAAAAIYINQALYGNAPSNAIYTSDLAYINSTSTGAYAVAKGALFASTSNDALATLVLNNLGITATTVPAASYTILQAAVATQFGLYPTMRGQVVLNLANILANFDTTDATWGAAAIAWNASAVNSLSYSADTTHTTSLAVNPAIATGQTYTLTVGADNFTGTNGNDTFTGSVTGILSAFDKLAGGLGSDTLTISDTAAVDTTALSLTISGMDVVNLNGTAGVKVDTTGWGTTALTVANSTAGNVNVTADSTTAVVATSTFATGTLTAVGGSTQNLIAKGGAITASKAAGAITATLTSAAATNSSYTGGVSVSVTESGLTTGNVTIGGATTATRPTGAVTATLSGSTATGASGTVTVTGGTSITVSDLIGNSTTAGSSNAGNITITGSAATTTVSVTQSDAVAVAVTAAETAEVKNAAGEVTFAFVAATTATGAVAAGVVSVSDVNAASGTLANSIASVTLNNYGNSTIASNALTSLSLSGTGGTLGITNAATTPANTTLALAVNNLGGANTITDVNNEVTTLNITTGAAASTIAGIAATGVTALTVAGSSGLTLTAAGMSALKTITVAGAAGLTDSDLGSIATLTSVDASGTSGNNTVSLLATQTAYTGGSGVDTVTIGAVASKVIDGGAGTADVLVSNTTTYAANAKIVNFETLKMGGAANGTFVATGFSHLAAGAVTGVSTFSSVAAGADLTLNGAAGFGIIYTLSDANGASDVLPLTVKSAGTTEGNSVTADGVETVNVTLVDTTAASHLAATETLTLAGTGQTTLTFAGTTPLKLALVDTVVTLTSVDASGMTGTGEGFTWTAPVLTSTAGVTVKGVAGAGTNVLDFGSYVAGKVTYTGGAGADTVTLGTANKANVLNLGNGTNIVNGASAGSNVITGGTGADTFTSATTGNNVINFGNGANAFTATSGNNTYTGGTGVDTVTVGGGSNTITTGTGADLVTITAAGANVNTYTTITDAHAGMQIAVGNLGTETFVSAKVSTLNANTAVFQDYANAVAAQASNADHSANAAWGWFQFGGNTYLEQIRHDTTLAANDVFVNGTDYIICLTGLVDLSTATGGTTNALTLV